MLIQIQIDTADKLKNLKSFKDRLKSYDDVIQKLLKNNELYLEYLKENQKNQKKEMTEIEV